MPAPPSLPVRVLVIEDDQRMRSLIERGLREDSFDVEVAADGAIGLARLSSGEHHACVLDCGLPSLDGFAVLESARAAGVRTPVVMLTARDAIDDRVRGLEAGADDYVTKPFAFVELSARLRAVMRRSAPEPRVVMRVGELSLVPATHRVERAGVPVELSHRQFALLELLMRRRGEVISRRVILERVFEYNFDPGTNIVDVHIAQLRRRVDKPGAPSLIETVRGVGYRFYSGAHVDNSEPDT
jgi:two-component system OmpR family response regulator